ncbi:TPA: hypothetical protein ACG5K7_000542 [Streptococcus agalactiae]
MKKYIDEEKLQIAMSEYKTIHPNARLKDQYDNTIGVVSEVYDNTSHSGE